MSEEYLSGFCPRCGEALTVPAKLSEFSCMFCGARLSADELLDTPAGPTVSLAPDEAASRFDTAKKQLPSCVRRFRGYQKKVTKNEFEAAFSDVYQAAEPVFRALDEAVSAMPGQPGRTASGRRSGASGRAGAGLGAGPQPEGRARG